MLGAPGCSPVSTPLIRHCVPHCWCWCRFEVLPHTGGTSAFKFCPTLVTSGGSWWKWPGGLRNFISGWTYRIIALPLAVYNGVSSHSSSPKLIKLVISAVLIDKRKYSLQFNETDPNPKHKRKKAQPVPLKVWRITSATKA